MNKYDIFMQDFDKAKCIIFTEYQGLNSTEISELRKNMRSLNVKYRVLKNTIASLVLKQKSMEDLISNLKGPTAVVLIQSPDDLLSVSKNLVQFAKEHKYFKIRSGYIPNKMLTLREITEISALPSRDILIGKVIGLLKTPLLNIVGVLSAPQRELVCVISKIKPSKG
jgi:large subunit ribosomal protein L10